MTPDLWYVLVAVIATMFVANSVARGEVILWDLVVGVALCVICLNQAGLI